MTRVAPFSQQSLILQHTLNHQSQMLDKQVQLSSGKIAQRYTGIARDASRLVTNEAAKERTLQFMNNIDVVQQRLTLVNDAMSNIDEIAREARKVLNATLDGPESHQSDFVDFMSNVRALVADALNTKDGTRFVFSGSRVDQAPVSFNTPYRSVSLIESNGTTVDQTFYDSYYEDVLGNTLPYAAGTGSFYEQIFFDKNGVLPDLVGFPVVDPDNPTMTEFNAEDPGLWQYYIDRLNSAQMLANPKTDYYYGDSVDPQVRADDGFSITYGARANAPAFQQMLIAVDAMMNLPQSTISTPEGLALIQKARDMLDTVLTNDASDGFQNLTELQVKVNGPRSTLASIRDRHERFTIYADEIIQEVEGIDQAELIASLQSDQVQLEASYAVLSRISSLTILDFLR